MKQKYVEWSKATWWVLGFAAQSPPFRMEAPPSSSLGSVDGRRTAAVLLCGNFLCLGAVLPQFHSFWHSPNLMIGQWESDRANLPCLDSRQLWKTIPAPERPVGSAKASGADESHFNFPSCSILLPSMLYQSWSQEHSPVNFRMRTSQSLSWWTERMILGVIKKKHWKNKAQKWQK